MARGKKIQTDRIDYGIRLKAQRERVGLKQFQLAERIGVSAQTISKLETGRMNFSVELIRRICKCLNISTDTIILGKAAESDIDDIVHSVENMSLTQKDYMRASAKLAREYIPEDSYYSRVLSHSMDTETESFDQIADHPQTDLPLKIDDEDLP